MAVLVQALSEDDVRERVTSIVARFFDRDPSQVDAHTPLALYGLDSLRSMELVALLEESFERSLPEWLFVEYPEIDSLSKLLSGAAGELPDALNLMIADSQLPDDIRPSNAGTSAGALRHVLLTGSTGFLGAHLLRALLDETQAQIHCLVRGTREAGPARIRRALERYDLWDPAATSRVHAVSGDLLQPNAGLDLEAYGELCEKLDTVYHAAADVDWVASYPALREANVLGTRELIRLACTGRPKVFHFISSLSVCYASGGPLVVREPDDMLPFVDRLPLGYAQSKCVAEALVRQATERGMTARIYRPSLIAGDSRSGASNIDDLVAALIKGCVEMGAAPDLDWTLDAAPVEYIARAVLRLSAPNSTRLESYHVNNPSPRHWRECVLWMNLFGYRVELVPYERWLQQLAHDSTSPEHALHRLRSFFLRRQPDGRTIPELYQDSARSVADCDRSRRVGATRGLDCPRLDAELLDRYFNHYIARGFLTPPARRREPKAAEPKMRACFEDPSFVETLLKRRLGDGSVRVCEMKLISAGSEHSIIGELTSWRHRRRTGLFRYRVTFERSESRQTVDIIVKAKPADRLVVEVGETIAAVCDQRLAGPFRAFGDRLGARDGHVREIAIYEEADSRLRRYMPFCFGTWQDAERDEWGLALEYLDGLALKDAYDDPSVWSRSHIEATISGLAEIHAASWGRDAELRSQPWIGHIQSVDSAIEMTPLWDALADHAAPYMAGWAGPEAVRTLQTLVATIGDWWRPLDSLPRTLIHNDFNPRNAALRHDGSGFRLCAYDWELATLGVPQRDLAELLCFVLPPDVSSTEASYYLELHRMALETAIGHSLADDEWRLGFRSALSDLLVSRLTMYTLINRVRRQPFLPRVVRTWRRLYEILEEEESGTSNEQ